MNPTTEQLDQIEAWANSPLGSSTVLDLETVTALVAEVRRLRAEEEQRTEDLASADDPTRLRWGLNDVLWGDDDTITVLLSGPEGEPYWLELEPERAAVLREDLAGPPPEETHVVADDSDDPEHIDDCPGCTAFTLTGHIAAAVPAVPATTKDGAQ